MCAKSQLQLSIPQQDLERLNRARDFFGDPMQRWHDGLTLKNSSKMEAYANGRIALVIQCRLPTVNVAIEPDFARVIGKDSGMFNDDAFIILKADTRKPHYLESWNQELVFINDIQIVQGPEERIPSLVGFYRIQNKIMDCLSDSLLFQSAFYPLLRATAPLILTCSCILDKAPDSVWAGTSL